MTTTDRHKEWGKYAATIVFFSPTERQGQANPLTEQVQRLYKYRNNEMHHIHGKKTNIAFLCKMCFWKSTFSSHVAYL